MNSWLLLQINRKREFSINQKFIIRLEIVRDYSRKYCISFLLQKKISLISGSPCFLFIPLYIYLSIPFISLPVFTNFAKAQQIFILLNFRSVIDFLVAKVVPKGLKFREVWKKRKIFYWWRLWSGWDLVNTWGRATLFRGRASKRVAAHAFTSRTAESWPTRAVN